MDQLLGREWLETDGLGNWASGTASGVHTRRFHGWLAAEESAGDGHRLLLAKCEETVFVDGQRYELGANCYPDTIHPQGYRFLTQFRLDPWPTWRYELDGLVLERELLMLHGTATTLVVYSVLASPGPVALELRPLVAGRGAWSTETENPRFSRRFRSFGEQLEMAPYAEGSRLVLTYPQGRFQGDGFWFYSFVYSHDDDDPSAREDLFNPGMILFTLQPGESRSVAVSTAPLDGLDLEAALAGERERRDTLRGALPDDALRCALPDDTLRGALPDEALATQLLAAADQYLVRRHGRPAIVPCYPGGGDRHCERLWALPGLTLPGGRLALARELLAVRRGALASEAPCRTLWYAWALGWFEAAGGTGGQLWSPVSELLDAWQASDGPATVGEQARWHHAATLLGRRDEAHRIAASFARRWGDAPTDSADWLLALALQPDLLPRDTARARLAELRALLQTPYGVRPSAEESPRPAWLGLLGDALLALEPDGHAQAAGLLTPFAAHLREGALGHISERLEPGGASAGCLGHAPAVGELLRLAWRLRRWV